ncbi:hypothetical protein QE152_g29564 [Popillia japonica]|uniref:Uncharacterized protein n=1 Tax=Popillia japonica TaxID=7064 RepID=A0AAW1JIA8_POPJA
MSFSHPTVAATVAASPQRRCFTIIRVTPPVPASIRRILPHDLTYSYPQRRCFTIIRVTPPVPASIRRILPHDLTYSYFLSGIRDFCV